MKHFKKIALTGIAVLTGTLLAACGGVMVQQRII